MNRHGSTRLEGALKGAGIGVLGGAALGALLGAISEPPAGDEFRGLPTLLGAVIFAGVGLPVGAILGATLARGRWEAIPPDRLKVGFTPYGYDGLALSAFFRF